MIELSVINLFCLGLTYGISFDTYYWPRTRADELLDFAGNELHVFLTSTRDGDQSIAVQSTSR